MTVRQIFSAFLIGAAATAAACAHRAAPPAVRPALNGRWTLAGSGARSDTGALASATTGGADIAPPPSPRTGERPGYADRRESGMRSFDPGAMRAAMEAVQRGDSRITIAEGDGSVHLDYADGSYFDLHTDGRKQDDIWRGVGRVRAGAYWSETGLVLERKIEETGVTVRQTFVRTSGSPRLNVTTEVKGSAPRPLTLHREYVLAESAARAS